MKHCLFKLVILVALLFSGMGLSHCQPAYAQETEVSVAAVQAETQIPVLLPDLSTLNLDTPLYSDIIYTAPDGYYIAYGFTPNCADAGFCNYARVKAYRLGATATHFKPDTLDALTTERAEVLAEAPYISPNPIETVSLADLTPATVLPWYSYTNPGNTEIIFERQGIRYLFAIEMAPNSEIVEMANSAL